MEPVSNKALMGTPPIRIVELGLTGVLVDFMERRLKQAIKHWGRNPFTDLPIGRFPKPWLVFLEPYILPPVLPLRIPHLPQHSVSISGMVGPWLDQNSFGIDPFWRFAWFVLALFLYSVNSASGSGREALDILV